jgi:hypothetical protein
MARPSEYCKDKAADICARLAEGQSLRRICALENMPDVKTVYRWMGANEEFRQQYALAREDQADTLADEIIDISDDQTEDPQSRRVRIDTRKWVASKLKPKKYGDKTDHNLQVAGKLVIGWQQDPST